MIANSEADFREKYPEAAKVGDIMDKTQAIGAFLEWLFGEAGYTLCLWHDKAYFNMEGEKISQEQAHALRSPDPLDDKYTYEPAGHYPAHKGTEALLADFFGIDLGKYEEEKRAMLADLREEEE